MTLPTQPFPDTRWRGFQARMTKAARDFTKRWKPDRSGFSVDKKAMIMVKVVLVFRGSGELVGYTNPQTSGMEPRSLDWFEELALP